MRAVRLMIKGRFPAIIAAEESIRENTLPANLKFLFEGEEEIGSPTLKSLLESHKDLLGCNLVLSVDGGMYSNRNSFSHNGLPRTGCDPDRCLGASYRRTFGWARRGHYAPIQALSHILSSMKDEDGRITVEGFYDDVSCISEKERNKIAEAPFDREDYVRRLGISDLFGEPEFSPLERMWIRPTLDPQWNMGWFSRRRGQDDHTIACRL